MARGLRARPAARRRRCAHSRPGAAPARRGSLHGALSGGIGGGTADHGLPHHTQYRGRAQARGLSLDGIAVLERVGGRIRREGARGTAGARRPAVRSGAPGMLLEPEEEDATGRCLRPGVSPLCRHRTARASTARPARPLAGSGSPASSPRGGPASTRGVGAHLCGCPLAETRVDSGCASGPRIAAPFR